MGKSVDNPKIFIISCRVNCREMASLQELAEESGISISNLLRQSLALLKEKQVRRREANA